MPDNHPFTGRKGSAFVRRFKDAWFKSGRYACEMCGAYINGEGNQCHVDHKRPWRLRPDLAHDAANLWLICARCHNGTCESIERKHWPDADRIADAKARHRGIGADGWPTG